MEENAVQREYQKAEVKQGYNPLRNPKRIEPIWKTDRGWKEFYIVYIGGAYKKGPPYRKEM
jgi:hypothetical protein